jgi:3-oxoacyl-[acyl-carrier-protein] synthase-3
VVSGLGAWLPPTVVTNDDLTAELDTTDQWIRSRTGIGARHVVDPHTGTSLLATEAGRLALESAGATSVDAVVLATSTPDRSCPATAPEVAANLGLGGRPAFDVAAVCTGFLYALATAQGLLAARTAKSVLVIGADAFSTILDPRDRTTRVIFGDGGGAMVLRAGQADEPGALLAFDLGSDGARSDLIQVPGGDDPYFRMDGKPVFSQAVVRMAESAQHVADTVGWTMSDVDMLIAHQANKRILAAVGEQLGLHADQVASHLELVGNTVAASVPLALAHAVGQDRIAQGDRLLLAGFGGGLTWGAAALSWPDVTPFSSHPPVRSAATERQTHVGAH